MKKAKQLLEKLPEPYRGQALGYFSNDFFKDNHEREKPMNTIGSALLCSFNWENTYEGHKYWNDLHLEYL